MRTTFAPRFENGRPGRSSRIPRVASKFLLAVAGAPLWLARMAVHPVGASVCLALGYIIFCAGYLVISGRIAASQAMSVEQLRKVELMKGLTFTVITGGAYFGFA